MRPGHIGLGVNRLQPHVPHQPLHPLTINGMAPHPQCSQASGAIERHPDILFVNKPHEPALFRTNLGLIIAGQTAYL